MAGMVVDKGFFFNTIYFQTEEYKIITQDK